MDDLEKIAKTHCHNKEYDKAITAYQNLIAKYPKREDLIISCANCYDLFGEKKKAIDFYKKALKINKNSSIATSNLATALYENNQFDEAKSYALKSIELDSFNASSWIILGNIDYCTGNFEEALKDYMTARSVKPDYYIAEINIANTYFDMKKYLEAISFAKKALSLDSKSVLAYSLIGNSYHELELYDDALQALTMSLQLDSNDPWLYNSLSQVLQKKGHWEQAVKAGLSAIEKSSDKDSQHINLGYLLYEFAMEKKDSLAIKYADFWLEKYPSNQIVQHMANAIKNTKLERANDEYIKNIFDIFADDFEKVLDSLEYRAPELIFGFLKEFYAPDSSPKLRILDAGCGTGLCGKFLKKYSSRFGLYGVDLSEKMLKVAAQKKLYNKLYNCELISFLGKHKKAYNLIVASDVLTYIGDLDILFANLSDSLKKNSRVIFTVSENIINVEDYILHASGRFLHSHDYVLKTLEKHGLLLEKIAHEKLRNEGDREVFGFVISAIKKPL